MRELNRYWLILIITGIFFMVFVGVFGIIQSMDSANASFRENIINFNSNVLVPENIREHLEENDF